MTNQLMHLGFHRAKPCKALHNFIDSYWFIDAFQPANSICNEYLHPDGGFGIIFNFGNTLSFDNKTNKEMCFFDGTNTKTRLLGLSGHINAIGIRFKPSAAHAFLPVSLRDLKNETISLADAGLKNLSNLHNVLATYTSLKNKTQALDKAMFNCFDINSKPTAVDLQALRIIKNNRGLLPVEKVVQQLGMSQRKLERLFSLQVGMTPAEYSKTIRIKHARDSLKQLTMSYQDIQFNLEYFDQSHFIKQFKSVVGITPGQYRQRFIK